MSSQGNQDQRLDGGEALQGRGSTQLIQRHYNPSEVRDLTDMFRTGTQQLYYFENGYGASVICHSHSYGHEKGLWELAVLKNNNTESDRTYPDDWDLCDSTPIAGPLGYLTEVEVQFYLDQIAGL